MHLSHLDDQKILEALIHGDYVDAADVERAQVFAKEHRASVIDYLLSEDLVTRDLIGQAIAESQNVSYADLNSRPPSQEDRARIPEEIAVKHRLVFFEQNKKGIVIATDDLEKAQEAKKDLDSLFKGIPVQLAYALSDDVDEVLRRYRKTLDTRFSKILQSTTRVAPEIITEIIDDALLYRASDIHFEPQEKDVVIRFRIDGIMEMAGALPRQYYDNILNRMKVLARLRIDEHLAAQDGAIRYENDGQATDMRVSIVPTVNGEKIVLRLLSENARGFSLADIGMSPDHEKRLEDAFSKPFGMILVTGPTGSGKTTTLYAVLKHVNSPTLNITTIEDPVEYKISGINQIQVNSDTNLTFAKGLRSIVRQDPDVILVGEIRDTETAEIAVNAALTGHLLLSTFHANDAPTAIPRLIDMGVEPFLLASTLEALIAQRLVRRICDECRTSVQVSTKEIVASNPALAPFFPEKEMTFYKGKGCDVCHQSGYRGRTAIMEFISVSPAMEELILSRPSTADIWDLARKEGARTLFEDGIEKVKSGATTLEEVLRVAEPPEIQQVRKTTRSRSSAL